MRKLALLFLLLTGRVYGQLNPAPFSTGSITTNAANCNTTNACVVLHMATSNVGYSVTVSGTWTGTLTVEQSGDNQGSWASATTTTANTLYTSALTPGITDVRVRGSAAMTGAAVVTITASGPATLQNITQTGGSSVASVGPVINVTNPAYAGCGTALADYSTCLTSVATAATTAAYTSTGGIAFKNQCTAASAAATSLSCNITIAAGDTVIVQMMDNHSSGQTIVVSDSSGTNPYGLIGQGATQGGGSMKIYISNAGIGSMGKPTVAAGATSVTVTSTPSEVYSIDVATYSGVGAIGNYNMVVANAGSTAPSATWGSQDNNNFMVTGIGWVTAGAVTASANVGNLRSTIGSTASTFGLAVVDNTAATPGSITTSATLSGSSPWGTQTVELRSFTVSVPGVCFPPGVYTYTSTISFPRALTLFACSGPNTAWLCYQGSAHAMDIGLSGLSGSGTGGSYGPKFTIKDLAFTCGQSMTQGIFINNHIFTVYILDNHFLNFGPANLGGASAGVFEINSSGDNQDLLVQGNKVENYDSIPRSWLFVAASSTSNPRILGNFSVCGKAGLFGVTACSGSGDTGAIVTIGGPTGQVTDNNFAYGCPLVHVLNGAFATRVTNNLFEATSSGTCPVIQFETNIDGLKVLHNYANLNSAQFMLAPLDGAQTLQNATVAHNHLVVTAATTELAQLNNLTGQTGNLLYQNMCAVGTGAGSAPCQKAHTAGGNINQWNNDYAGTCTMVAGVCPTYTFGATYFVAPKCVASWTGSGTFTGILQAISTTTTLVVKDVVGTDTGVMNWSCNPDAQ